MFCFYLIKYIVDFDKTNIELQFIIRESKNFKILIYFNAFMINVVGMLKTL